MTPPSPERTAMLMQHEQMIADCRRKGFRWLRFPREIETLLHADTLVVRRKELFWFSLLAIVFFDLFAPMDARVVPDIYPTALKLRFLVATPVCLVLAALILHPAAGRFIDGIAALLNLVGSSMLAVIYTLSNHPNVQHFHIGVLPIVLFANIVLRLRFRYACLVSLATLIIHYMMISRVESLPDDLAIHYLSIMFVSVVISLIAAWHIEHDMRANYLRQLSDEIRALHLQQARDEMERVSTLDALTGLANRRHFDRCLEAEWQAACISGASLSLAFIDVDDFKSYNDHFGHQGGDDCLRIVAGTIAEALQRSQDLCARYGGEEFVVLLCNTEADMAGEIAERIRQRVADRQLPHPRARAAAYVTASIGVATVRPGTGLDAHELIERADKALYEAKARGRNQVRVAPA